MKKFKKILSFLLCFAMLLSCMTTVSYAELTTPADGKAKLELSLIKEDSGSSSGWSDMTQNDIKALKEGSSFFVGVKGSNFDNIAGADNGLFMITFAIDYRTDCFTAEPNCYRSNGSFNPSGLQTQMKNRLSKKGTNSLLFDSGDLAYAYNATQPKADENTTNNTAAVSVSIATTSEDYTPYIPAKGTVEYLAIFEFKVNDTLPTDTSNVLSMRQPSAGSGFFSLSYGTNGLSKAYQSSCDGGNTDVNAVIDFADGTNIQYLFPAADPAITGSVTIDNTTPTYGDTLTASVSGLNAGKTAKYQWYRGTNAISGATNATYKPVAADVGQEISVKVTADGTTGTINDDRAVKTAAVGKATLTVSGATVTEKTFNNNTTATVTGAAVSGKVNAGDVVTVNATGTFADKNAGTNKNVTVNYSLTGAAANAYQLNKTTETLKGNINKKALTLNANNVSVKVGKDADLTASVTGEVTGASANVTYAYAVKGTSDKITVNGTKVHGDANGTGTVTVTATIGDTTNYEFDANGGTKDITVTVQEKEATGITILTQPTKTEYNDGDDLDLTGLTVKVTYDNGTDEEVALADFAAKGIAVTPANGAKLEGAGTKTITVTTNGKTATTNVTVKAVVAKVDPTIKINNKTQTVGKVSPLNLTITPRDEAATYTVEIEVDIVDTPAVPCTCPEVDGVRTHDPSNTECHKADAVTHKGYVAWDDANVNDLAAGTYNVRVNYTGGTTTKNATHEDTLTLSKPSSGGGGSSAYTVKFNAGTNGKITDGKATVSVNKNGQLTKANVPTVKANDGFKFLGWSLDGKTVVDPTEAKVTKSMTYTALYEAVKGGHETYMFGYADGTFKPNANITRAEAAALMARMNAEYDLTANYTGNLKDVVAGQWYTKVINFNVEKGLITGYTDGTFKPNNAITRQEFCTIVAKYLGLENTGNANFTDTKGVYAEGFIAQLVEKGIVSGYNDGSFKPNANITRAEATRIINGVFDRTPNKETVDAHIAEYNVNLKDVPATHWAYYEILEAAVNHTPADFHK